MPPPALRTRQAAAFDAGADGAEAAAAAELTGCCSLRPRCAGRVHVQRAGGREREREKERERERDRDRGGWGGETETETGAA
jgi:hypothetical protein